MSPQPIVQPPKVLRVVETPAHVLPLRPVVVGDVRIRRHARKAQHRLLVGDVRPWNLGDGPRRRIELQWAAPGPPGVQDAVDVGLRPVGEALDAQRLHARLQPRAGFIREDHLAVVVAQDGRARDVEPAVEVRVRVCAVVEDVP